MYYDTSFKKMIALAVLLVVLFGGSLGTVFGVSFLWRTYAASLRTALLALQYRIEFAQFAPSSFLAALVPFFNTEEGAHAYGKALSVPVLTYHGISFRQGEGGVPLEVFKDQMFSLKRAGYETISMEDFYLFMKGEKELPEKSFLLTFDDGIRTSYSRGDPFLKALGYQASMFVITSFSFPPDPHAYYLSERELQEMIRTGRWEIYSHGKRDHETYQIDKDGTQGHFLSNRLWLDQEQRLETQEEFVARITEDLYESRREIEEALDVSSIAFAYPFGDFGQNPEFSNVPDSRSVILDAVRSMYLVSFYQWWQEEGFRFNYPGRDEFLARRIEPGPDLAGESLLNILEQGRAKRLPYEDDFQSDAGWIPTWGLLSVDKDTGLSFQARQGEQGASAILDGTYAWEDYELQAQVSSPTQSGVFIWVRFQDANNNAGCNFGRDFVHAEEVINGVKNVIKGVRGTHTLPADEFTAGVRVQGRKIECLLNNEVVLSSDFLDRKLSRGGIGFKMWAEDPMRPSLEVTRLEVYELSSLQ